MLRNNKRHCRGIDGRPLFQPVGVTTRTFGFSPAERALYDRLSQFVREGMVFGGASKPSGGPGGGAQRSTRSWLLYALQKIATSSVAALIAAVTQPGWTSLKRV